jgi:hypothetical protein
VRDDAAEEQAEAVSHDHEVGVVGDEGAGGPQVQEGPRRRRLVGEGVHVRHHVVAEAALVARRGGEVRVVEVRPHLGQRLVRDRQAQLTLGLRQRQPDPAPQPDAVRLAPQTLHRGGRVTGAERRGPALVAHRNTRSVKVI